MKSDRIVGKIGTNSLTNKGLLNEDSIFRAVQFVRKLKNMGKNPVLVSSGAVAAGMELFGIKERPKDINELKFLSGVGARGLQNAYAYEFDKYGMQTLYLPVTWRNFADKEESRSLASMMIMGNERNVGVIINNNDAASSDELIRRKGHPSGFYDNDFVALKVAQCYEAGTLVMITDRGNMGTGGGESKNKVITEAKKSGIETIVGGIKLLENPETWLR